MTYAIAVLMAPLMVDARPVSADTVLCVGEDGHVAIEPVCGGHHPSHLSGRETGCETSGIKPFVGHHTDATHAGGCEDFRLIDDHQLQNTASFTDAFIGKPSVTPLSDGMGRAPRSRPITAIDADGPPDKRLAARLLEITVIRC